LLCRWKSVWLSHDDSVIWEDYANIIVISIVLHLGERLNDLIISKMPVEGPGEQVLLD
jgi:hypothetical protein